MDDNATDSVSDSDAEAASAPEKQAGAGLDVLNNALNETPDMDAEMLSDDLIEAADDDTIESTESSPLGITALADVTEDDIQFIQRVFNQVKDVDFRAPPPPPPRGLSGPDKKLQDLREKVRKLERELARVAFIWSSKSEEVLRVDQIVRDKEKERASTAAKYRQFKDRALQALTSHKEEIESLKAVVDSLTLVKQSLELQVRDLQQDLEREQQDKAALMNDFRTKMEAAQNAFTQLREQSTRVIGNLEGTVAARDGSLEEVRGELRRAQETLSARDATLDERQRAATTMQVELEKRITQLTEQMASQRAEGEQKLTQASEHAATARADFEQRLKTKDDDIARLQADIVRSQADIARLQAEIVLLKTPAPTPSSNA